MDEGSQKPLNDREKGEKLKAVFEALNRDKKRFERLKNARRLTPSEQNDYDGICSKLSIFYEKCGLFIKTRKNGPGKFIVQSYISWCENQKAVVGNESSLLTPIINQGMVDQNTTIRPENELKIRKEPRKRRIPVNSGYKQLDLSLPNDDIYSTPMSPRLNIDNRNAVMPPLFNSDKHNVIMPPLFNNDKYSTIMLPLFNNDKYSTIMPPLFNNDKYNGIASQSFNEDIASQSPTINNRNGIFQSRMPMYGSNHAFNWPGNSKTTSPLINNSDLINDVNAPDMAGKGFMGFSTFLSTSQDILKSPQKTTPEHTKVYKTIPRRHTPQSTSNSYLSEKQYVKAMVERNRPDKSLARKESSTMAHTQKAINRSQSMSSEGILETYDTVTSVDRSQPPNASISKPVNNLSSSEYTDNSSSGPNSYFDVGIFPKNMNLSRYNQPARIQKIPSPMPNQISNQIHGQIPNQIHGQIPNQKYGRILNQIPGQLPNKISTPKPIEAQSPYNGISKSQAVIQQAANHVQDVNRRPDLSYGKQDLLDPDSHAPLESTNESTKSFPTNFAHRSSIFSPMNFKNISPMPTVSPMPVISPLAAIPIIENSEPSGVFNIDKNFWRFLQIDPELPYISRLGINTFIERLNLPEKFTEDLETHVLISLDSLFLRTLFLAGSIAQSRKDKTLKIECILFSFDKLSKESILEDENDGLDYK